MQLPSECHSTERWCVSIVGALAWYLHPCLLGVTKIEKVAQGFMPETAAIVSSSLEALDICARALVSRGLRDAIDPGLVGYFPRQLFDHLLMLFFDLKACPRYLGNPSLHPQPLPFPLL